MARLKCLNGKCTGQTKVRLNGKTEVLKWQNKSVRLNAHTKVYV